MNLGQSDMMVNWAIVDAARADTSLPEILSLPARSTSLYRDESLFDVAPYLASIGTDPGLLDTFVTRTWGKSSTVLFQADESFELVARHFRKFLIVKTESEEKLYFRYYDPRVLRVFLPTCSPAQVAELFGPVRYFLVEDEDPAVALLFFQERGGLRVERIEMSKETVASRLPKSLQQARLKEKPNVIV